MRGTRWGNFCKKFPQAPSRVFNAYLESANIVRWIFEKTARGTAHGSFPAGMLSEIAVSGSFAGNDPCVVPLLGECYLLTAIQHLK